MYDEYFIVRNTPKQGIKVEAKTGVIAKKKRYFGFLTLISNETMTAIEALDIYRNKDLIEKSFGNLKERLNTRRALVSSEESLDGKLFVEFIALIYLSELHKRMYKNNLFKRYTLQGVLDELDLIECCQTSGKKLRLAEILKKRKIIYYELGVRPQTSL